MNDIKWWEEQPRLWKRLVPKSGQAHTVQGELIRCAGKATDEAYRNGNMNWDSGYERLIQFLVTIMDDSNTFTEEERSRIRASADCIIENSESPDLSGHGSPYYYLTEMAVRWCLAHPDPIPHRPDPTLPL